MPKESLSIEIEAPCHVVFDLVHDYNRRLQWDSMLTEARLLNGATEAGLGVRSVCTGTWRSAFLALETEYVQFIPGQKDSRHDPEQASLSPYPSLSIREFRRISLTAHLIDPAMDTSYPHDRGHFGSNAMVRPIHRGEAVVSENGTIVIENTPFQPGETVEVTIVHPAATEREKYYPLKGTILKYDDPFGSVAEDDWDALKFPAATPTTRLAD